MVPEPSRGTGGLPTTVNTDSTLNQFLFPTRGGYSTSTLIVSDWVAHVGERHRADGLSETAAKVLLSSWSDSTRKRLSVPWSSWCFARSTCPFTAPVSIVLTFLVAIAERDKLAHRTIDVYKKIDVHT